MVSATTPITCEDLDRQLASIREIGHRIENALLQTQKDIAQIQKDIVQIRTNSRWFFSIGTLIVGLLQAAFSCWLKGVF